MRVAVLAAAALLAAAPAPAQDAAAFVPLGSRLDRLLTWAQESGVFSRTLDPLVRPWRLDAVRRAVTAEDTTSLAPAPRRAWRDVAAELERIGPNALVAEVGFSAHRNGRRDSFRPGGGRGARPAGGIWAAIADGPFVAVVNPAFEERLRDDPEFNGYVRPEIAGRMQTAYLGVTGRRGALTFGRMARQWGPSLFDGLLVSPSAYATDDIAGAVVLGRFELSALARRLENDTVAMGTPAESFNRFFFAHRLSVNAGRGVWLGFTEAGVYGGRGQTWQPGLHAPANSAVLTMFNDRIGMNGLVSVDAVVRRGRSRLELAAMLDDIQVDDTLLTDQRPASYGFTFVARTALPHRPVHAALGYTRVSSLAYRNAEGPGLGYLERGVGLGRNFSDYDQWLLRLEARPGAAWHVALDLTHIRQGAGDMRSPFPPDSQLAQPGQGFLLAPVTSSSGVRVTVAGEPVAGLDLRFEGGVVGGNGSTEGIAAVAVHFTYDVLRRAAGSPWRGVEAGAQRAWP